MSGSATTKSSEENNSAQVASSSAQADLIYGVRPDYVSFLK